MVHYWVSYVWWKFDALFLFCSILFDHDELSLVMSWSVMYIAWTLFWYNFCWFLENSGKLVWSSCTVHLRLHEEDEVASDLWRFSVHFAWLGFAGETAPFWCWRASFWKSTWFDPWRATFFKLLQHFMLSLHFPCYMIHFDFYFLCQL